MRKRRLFPGVVSPLAAMLIVATMGPGPTYAVGSATVGVCDETHLRSAIGAAGAGGRVTFKCSGTIGLSATIALQTSNNGLVIDGTGQSVVLSGEQHVGIFSVPVGVTASLAHLTLAD